MKPLTYIRSFNESIKWHKRAIPGNEIIGIADHLIYQGKARDYYSSFDIIGNLSGIDYVVHQLLDVENNRILGYDIEILYRYGNSPDFVIQDSSIIAKNIHTINKAYWIAAKEQLHAFMQIPNPKTILE